ncbi:mTERF domain-containing protein, mitochondrial [Marchantia polymorpha subsp. ruderalis]|uniref:Uncharacterized protein n=2 Tax=Marchantia polymorpha TaxID=3197 RepID=A0AAF6AY85_MARPO|nr:hypothetical protein MARPO_0006s0185 [Marchantia polymorpha]BBN04719.1 hypothetical protein Mp_3g07120 [Marchantia polymorpha subsp. ruderalis]|eukprot:PTQ48163.1 hypothetical protein MARPO_0006s0185 [Marchantia polymorpha]
MPTQRTIGCAGTVLGNTMLTWSVAGALPSVESLLMRIAVAFPFSNVAWDATAGYNNLESASSPLRSDPGTSSNFGHTNKISGTVSSFSTSPVLNTSVVKGTSSKTLGYGHSVDVFVDTRAHGRRRSTYSMPFHEYGMSVSKYSTTAVEVKTEAVTAGKSWKGKGWNRAPTSEVLAAVIDTEGSEPSVATQFNNIPDLEEKLKFLETCGLGDNQLLQMRKRLPSAVKNTFLKLSMKKLIEVATFLDEEVGVQKKDFGNLLFANPYIAGSSVEECLRPKVEFLRQRGITKEEMGKMVLRSPQILTYSLEGKLLAIEQKLLEAGLKDEEIGRVFVRYPALIGTSISKFDKNVQSLKEAGISDIARAIFKIPQIMSLSLDNKYKGILQFLQEELHLQNDQISKIVSSQISILSFSVETNIRPKVGFFSEMGLQNDDIARLVVKYPNIFCHSLEKSIKPKVQYLVKEMNLQVMELISFPHYLSYSLPDRIRPRHEYVSKYGFNFRLSSLLSCCENVFHKRYPKPPLSILSGESLGNLS